MNKIHLWIAVGMVLLLLAFSALSYFYVSRSMIENQNVSDRKTLNQISYNIDYMNEVMKAICFNVYYNRDARSLVNDTTLDFGESMRLVTELRTSVVNTIPFIQSIYVYNSRSNKNYTTHDEMMFDDRTLNELINYYKDVPKQTPLYRKIYLNNSETISLDVVSYFLYEYKDQNGKPEGAIIVNYKMDWLMNNINKLNATAEQNDSIYIMDNKGDFLGINEDTGVVSALKSAYMNYKAINSDDSSGSFSSSLNDVNYMVNFSYERNTQWVLFKVKPVDQIFQNLITVRNAFIVMVTALIILSLVISRAAAKSIYKPIGSLVKQIRMNNPNIKDSKQQGDEIAYLKNFYNITARSLEKFEKEQHSNSSILKEHYLLGLLTDSYSIHEDDWKKTSEEWNLSLSGKNFTLCMLIIDDYKKFVQNNSYDDRELYKFLVINVASELLNENFEYEVIDKKDGKIVFILNDESKTDVSAGRIANCVEKLQKIFADNFQLKISAVISSKSETFKDLSKLYNEVVINSMYRFVYGEMSIITTEMVKSNLINKQQGYDPALENKMIQDIMTGNLNSFELSLEAVCSEISKLNYHSIILAVMQMINAIKITVEKLNTMRADPVFVDIGFLAGEVFEMETLDGLKTRILEVVKTIVSKTEKIGNERYVILSEKIKEIIDASYFDSGLYLPMIAGKLNMSEKHIARVFKSVNHMSINSYINEVRMKKAIEWLENSKLSINEIQTRIGIDNESYFYKLFKSKYGITPREYMMQASDKRGEISEGS